MEPTSVIIRFYKELNDFLPRHQNEKDWPVMYHGRRSVKDLIESLGVPHVEIDMIQAHGVPVNFDYIVRDRDFIQVYPGFRLKDPPRFIVDENVAKLCPLLRMLGFDTLYVEGATDSSIATISKQEERTILTRDKGLLKRKQVHSGLYVRATSPTQQVKEVVCRLKLYELCHPFSRCLSCNHKLVLMLDDEVHLSRQIPIEVRKWTNEFFQCTACQKVFWKGSHHESMEKSVRQILSPL